MDGQELFRWNAIDGLLQKFLDFTGADSQSMELNACDEAGRVDICVLEDDHGCPATKRQIEEWKAGEIRLWNCIYTFKVEKITTETVNLKEITV